MHVRCALRDLRGKRPLSVMAEASGVSAGILSQIERGLMFPADRQTARIEEAYGATVDAWYSPRVLLVLEADPEDDHG